MLPTLIEWPAQCVYWKQRRVQKRLKKEGMKFTKFDGCQYDLKSMVKDQEHLFIKKPWMFATTIEEILPLFKLECPGVSESHQHGVCRGKDAIMSQYYTPLIASLIHLAIMRHFKAQSVVINVAQGGTRAAGAKEERCQ